MVCSGGEQHRKKWLRLHILNSNEIVLSITMGDGTEISTRFVADAIGDLRDSLHIADFG